MLQSISKNSEITIGGDVKNVQSNNSLKLDIDAKIHIEKQVGNLLVKDWSDDVTLLIDVMRFKKGTFQKEKGLKSLNSNHSSSKNIELESVNLSNYL